MQEESGEFLHGADEGYAMGTVDVAIAGIGSPGGSRLGFEPIYDMPEQELGFIADNGGRNMYTLDNGGYRSEEWFSRGGRGPGQLREEGFKEIHVEHMPIYTEMTFGEEVNKFTIVLYQSFIWGLKRIKFRLILVIFQAGHDKHSSGRDTENLRRWRFRLLQTP